MAIDIATGQVELDRDDFHLPGRMPLRWTRRYRTGLTQSESTPLGAGWTTSWFPTLTRSGTDWIFVDREGGKHVFQDSRAELAMGKTIRLLGSFLELKQEIGSIEVLHWDVETHELERCVFATNERDSGLVLSAVENGSGDRLDLVWNGDGRLTTIRQSAEQRAISILYRPDGRIDSIALENSPDPTLVRYVYDQLSRLVAVVNRRELAHRYAYDDHSRLKEEILPDGAVYSYQYDDLNRCVAFTGLDRYNEKRLRYMDPIGTTVVTDSYGVTKTFRSLPSGQIGSALSSTGGKRETNYDDFGRIVEQIDEIGASTKYTYDEFGNRDSITDALGNVTQITYNEFHQPTSMTDPSGATWKREYNGRRLLSASVNPLGARWQFEYDSGGNPIRITDPQGFVRTLRYENGMLREETDFLGHVTSYKWDPFGRLVERIGPIGDVTCFRYDPSGNLVSVAQPDGTCVLASYDSGDNLSSYTDANGSCQTYRYGPCGRLLKRSDALGHTTHYEWGTEPDRLLAVVNEKKERYSYIYDTEGRMVEEISFDGRHHQFTYDAAGNCSSFINGNGECIRYKHDLLGRLVEETLPTGEKAVFAYDPVGRMVGGTNADSQVEFKYDPTGLLIQETQDKEWVRKEYNKSGELIHVTTSLAHDVSYELDANGRVAKLKMSGNRVIGFERDARGLEIRRSMAGKLKLEQRYDSMGRLVQQQVSSHESSAVQVNASAVVRESSAANDVERYFTYDKGGLLVANLDSRWGATEYVYDPAARLVGSYSANNHREEFTYDECNNLSTIYQQNGTSKTREHFYDTGNRLLKSEDTKFDYDADGRLIRKVERASGAEPTVWQYKWDAKGQLRELISPNGERCTYNYDAFGRRVSKKVLNQTSRFLWDEDVIIQVVKNAELAEAWILRERALRRWRK
ncbi:MAG: DUF6531 domain-containing protein [Pirellulaceae bacterium]